MNLISPIVSTKWLKGNLTDPDLIILDASPASNKSNLESDFTDIQIKNARFFDLKLFSDQKSDLPGMLPTPDYFTSECRKLGVNQDSKIVVYDNLGIYTSPRVWWMFKAMGYKNIAVLDGGLPVWVSENGDCVPKEQKDVYSSGDFTAKYNPEIIQQAQHILKNVPNQEFLVIDARSADRFYGKVPEPREGLASGHIPDSINLPFEKVLDNGKFLPAEELREIFTDLNPEGKPITFTCGSGITASILFLAAKLVNDNAKAVYDGSWSEWGQLSGYPVSTK